MSPATRAQNVLSCEPPTACAGGYCNGRRRCRLNPPLPQVVLTWQTQVVGLLPRLTHASLTVGLLPPCNITHSLNRSYLMYYAALARGAELLTAHCPQLTDFM